MAEIKRKRGELKRRVRVVVKVLWVKKKKKRGKKRDFDGRRFTVWKTALFAAILFLSFSCIYLSVSTSVIICPFCYLKLFVSSGENCSVIY